MVLFDAADWLLDAGDGNKVVHHTLSSNNGDDQEEEQHVKTFLTQIDTILSTIPPTTTHTLFSATTGLSVRSLSESILLLCTYRSLQSSNEGTMPKLVVFQHSEIPELNGYFLP